jgi:hypothetical protein
MHYGIISFDKILPKQCGYYGTRMKTSLENREFGHNARSATSRISFVSTPLRISFAGTPLRISFAGTPLRQLPLSYHTFTYTLTRHV